MRSNVRDLRLTYAVDCGLNIINECCQFVLKLITMFSLFQEFRFPQISGKYFVSMLMRLARF